MTMSTTTTRPAAQQLAADPVGLEIMWSRLIAITDEMWTTVLRTAVSPVIGAAQDYGCELLDANGNGLAHSTRSMPVFNLVMPEVTRALLKVRPVETMRPGDVYAANDPWLCAGHLDDIAIITPIFHGDRVVGFTNTVAHTSSIGGTLDGLTARDRYEEGLFIPIAKLYDRGEPNELLFDVIANNVRQPEMVLTDIAAQVAANEVGARRILAFLDEYGLDDLVDLAAILQERAEGAMRRAIGALPDGTYRGESFVEAPKEDLILRGEITIAGERIAVDFAGSAPQQPSGGINCTFTYTRAHTVYPLKCLLTPNVPNNEGCFRPIAVSAPEGSILNCRRNASVNARTITGWHIHSLIFEALAPALPDRVQAGNGLMHPLRATGSNADGTPFGVHYFTGGGRGAGGNREGLGYNCFPSSAGNVPVEVFEQRSPIVIDERTIMEGTGGDGVYRGTPGFRTQFRRLPASNADIRFYVHPDRMRHPAAGLFGGGDGNLTKVFLNGRDLTGGTGYLASGEIEITSDDDRLVTEAAGGGGIGSERVKG
ncbi:MAG: hydantoinase B/oxoprolinase family protein [Thermomicrobiales bacterium]|nr:hydantoinase B/oxoprolinase family protein [Thermomicrobiales bacterium]